MCDCIGKRSLRHARVSRCRHGRHNIRAEPKRADLRSAGPLEPPPDYTEIDRSPLNRGIMALFRHKMVAAIGRDSNMQGYDAIIDLTRTLNSQHRDPRGTQEATRGILKTLFPGWLPPAFKVMFSKPLPVFSNKLNAWVTAITCQWLMGPSKINDVELPDGSIAKGQGVLVERCRYLEESGCASICINSCKVPTQEFFRRDMGMDVALEPNYDDFSCQFAFGKKPLPQHEDEVFSTPCFVACPSKRKHRSQCETVVPRTES